MRRNPRTISAYKLTLIASMMILVLCAGVSFAQTEWTQWHYYVDVNVNTGPYARTATPVELQINFTNYLNGATLDTNSVRVAEFADSGRNGTPLEVVSQFDQGSGFNAVTNASGEVVWILRGNNTDPNALGAVVDPTPANTTRYYRVYFDDTNNGKSAPNYTTDFANATLEVSPAADWTTATTGSTPHIQSIGNYEVWFRSSNGSMWQMDNRRVTPSDLKLVSGSSTGGIYTAGTYYGSSDNGGEADSYYGSKNYFTRSANTAVRCTVVVNRTATASVASLNHNITIERKFYAGVPYFKNHVTIARNSGGNGFFNYAMFRTTWSTTAPSRTLVALDPVADPVTGGDLPYSAYFDWSDDRAGFAVLGSASFMPNSTNDLASGTNGYRGYYATTSLNRYWRFMQSPYYPIVMDSAIAIHTGKTVETARESTLESLEDYGCPVGISIVGSNTAAVAYGSIKGKITDALDNTKPVRGAMVKVWVDDVFFTKTYTSMLGDFTLSDVPAGAVKVSVKCDEYENKAETIGTLTAGSVMDANISLQPIIVAGAAVPNWRWLTSSGINGGTQVWKLATDSAVAGVGFDNDVATFSDPNYNDSGLSTVDVPRVDSPADKVTTLDWDDLQTNPTDNCYGWYRTTINIPQEWAGKNLRLRNFYIDDVAAFYFDGHYIGQTGSFPNASDPRNTAAANGYVGHANFPNDFIIPGDWLKESGDKVLAIKVFDATGNGGITGTAPLLEVAPSMATVTVNVTGPHNYGETPLPIEGATVQVVGFTSGTTDADGNCTFNTLPGDSYTITVTHPNHGTKTITNVEIPDAGSITIPVTYDAIYPVVTVNVTGSQTYNGPKLPVEGAKVSFGGSSGTTDADGNCTYDKTIAPGFYTVTVNHPNYGTKTLTNVEVPATPSVTIPVVYDNVLCKVTGTVTKNGLPLASARVVVANGSSSFTGITNSSGAYTITGVIAGDYKLTVNALKAMPVIDKPVQVYAMQVAVDNVDLQYGVTPIYDDFSGAALDESKWGFYNTSEQGLGNSTATLVDGVLNLYPIPGRGGILSKTVVPKYGTSEVLFTRAATGTNQGFAIIDPTYTGGDIYNHGVCFEQEGYFIKVFLCGACNWQVSNSTYPVRVSILRTGDYYDAYVNGGWSGYLGKMSVDSATGKAYLADNAQIYLNGYRLAMTNTTIGYFDEVKAGETIPVTPSTVAGARTAAGGSMLSVSGAVVTASYDNYFFIENTDRSAGIKVISTAKPAVGKVVSIAGSIVKADNEVAIKPIDATYSDDPNKAVPPPVAITGKVAGELDKAGAAAQGMIVKVAGTVTGLHTNTDNNVDGYFLDDGSGIVGDGTHKGIFVEMDPTWGTNSSVIGKFKTIVSPLTVKKISDTVVLPAVKGELEAIPTFTAYNDCCWSDGQTSGNITTYGTGTGSTGASTGFLKDYVTGVSFPVTATFTPSGDVSCVTAGGANCIDGSDAANVFGGKVDFTGYINCNTAAAYVELTFSGLDPNGSYEFTTTANAGGSLMTPMRYTISGALSFTNASSSDAIISTDGTYTEFDTGSNTGYSMGSVYGGYIAKWTGIKPSAAGTFTIKASLGDNNSNLSGAVFSGFMLKKAQ
ncbi:MAG: carboxypeptidase regulatory-like domain-containing protein [Armatimonadota bacterium]